MTMIKQITCLALALGVMAAAASANAKPRLMYGDVNRDLAETFGNITPHGLWDAR